MTKTLEYYAELYRSADRSISVTPTAEQLINLGMHPHSAQLWAGMTQEQSIRMSAYTVDSAKFLAADSPFQQCWDGTLAW